MLASLRYQKDCPSQINRDQARQVLAPALDRARRALRPAGHDDIVKALTALADTIQCSMPEELGLQVYVHCLQTLAYPALRHACVQVAMTHPFPRLPLPAEILAAGGGPQAELMFWEKNLSKAIALLDT